MSDISKLQYQFNMSGPWQAVFCSASMFDYIRGHNNNFVPIADL